MPIPTVTITSEEALKIAVAAVEEIGKIDPKRGAVCVVGRDGVCTTSTVGKFCSLFKKHAECEAVSALNDNKGRFEDFGDGCTITRRILTTEEKAEELIGAIAISGIGSNSVIRGICDKAAKKAGFFVDF